MHQFHGAKPEKPLAPTIEIKSTTDKKKEMEDKAPLLFPEPVEGVDTKALNERAVELELENNVKRRKKAKREQIIALKERLETLIGIAAQLKTISCLIHPTQLSLEKVRTKYATGSFESHGLTLACVD